MSKKRSRSEQQAYDVRYNQVYNELYFKHEPVLVEIIESLDETRRKLTEYRNELIAKEAKRIMDEES